MSTPVLHFGDFYVCFEAMEEDRSARRHFVKECGWTSAQFAEIEHCDWFCACVSIVKDGEQVACAYLGACSYLNAKEFYTTYRGDYFADMVSECAQEVGDPDLLIMVGAWRQALHNLTAAQTPKQPA